MEVVAELDSLRDFFGAEPQLEYPGIPYHENVMTVDAEIESGGRVWFKFMPSQGWAQLRLTGQPFSVVNLNLSDISHLSVRKTPEDHVLLVRFARKDTNNLKLWLRPKVLLFWGNEGADSDDRADLSIAGRGDADA